MASYGPVYPGSAANYSLGYTDWLNPSNITADDISYATNPIPDSDYTDRLVAYNFDFSAVSSSATLEGIVVEILRYQGVGLGDYVRDETLYLGTYDGTWLTTSANKASATYWPFAEAVETYGGAADLWTTGFTTVADVQGTNFAVGLHVKNFNAGETTAYVDYIRVTIYYTESSTPYNAAHTARPFFAVRRGNSSPPERAAFHGLTAEPVSAPDMFGGAPSSRAVFLPLRNTGAGIQSLASEYYSITPPTPPPDYSGALYVVRPPGPIPRPPVFSLRETLLFEPGYGVILPEANSARGRLAPPAPVSAHGSPIGLEPFFWQDYVSGGFPVVRAPRTAYLRDSIQPQPHDLPTQVIASDSVTGSTRPAGKARTVASDDPRAYVVVPVDLVPLADSSRPAPEGYGRGGAGGVLPADAPDLPTQLPDALVIRTRRYTGNQVQVSVVCAGLGGQTDDYAPPRAESLVFSQRWPAPGREPAYSLGVEPDAPEIQHALAVRPIPHTAITRAAQSHREGPALATDGEALPVTWGYQIATTSVMPRRVPRTNAALIAYERLPDPPPLPESSAASKPHPGARPGRGRGADILSLPDGWVAPQLQYVSADATTQRRVTPRGTAATADARALEEALPWAGADCRTVSPVIAPHRGRASGDLPGAESTEQVWWFASAAAITAAPARPRTGRTTNADYAARAGEQADSAATVGVLSAARSGVARMLPLPRRGSGDITLWHGEILSNEDSLRGWQGGGVSLARRVGRVGSRAGEWIVSAELADGAPCVWGQEVAAGRITRGELRGCAESSTPDWHGTGLIVWAGPGYAVAGGVWFAGALVGMIAEG